MTHVDPSALHSLHTIDEPPAQDLKISRQDVLEVREILRMLKRRRWLILGTVGVALVVAALLLSQLRPQYTASASVMVDPRQTNVVDLEEVLSGLPVNAETVQSEIEVLRSRDLAGRVVDKLKLSDNAEFSEIVRRQNEKSFLTDQDHQDTIRNAVIDHFLNSLTVKIAGRSRVITMSYRSHDPRLSAAIANNIVDLYVSGQLETRILATRNASSWLNQKLEQLRIDAESAELAVDRFKELNNLSSEPGRGTVVDKKTLIQPSVAKTNTDSLLSDTKESLQAQRNVLMILRDSMTPPAQWGDQDLHQMYDELVSLDAERMNLSSRLGPRHPKMVDVESRLNLAHNQFTQILNDRISQFDTRLKAGDYISTNQGTLLTSSDATAPIVEKLDNPEEARARLSTLEREAKANRTLYETFLNRYKQTTEQQGLEQADARVISRASIPLSPSFPNKPLFMLLTLVGALGVSLILAFIVEQMDAGFRSSDQIEALLGLPALAMVPTLKSLGVKGEHPESYIVSKPNSALAESVRALRMALLLADVDHPPRVVMITSALPGEGKTSLCLALARMAAMGGEKVVVVDADLRRPRIHEALHAPHKEGLVDALAKPSSLVGVIQQNILEECRFDYITAGSADVHSAELVRSAAMKQVVEELSRHYTLVILDTPPVLPVADAKLLSLLADKVIYVVRWNHTFRTTVQQAVKQLRDVKAKFSGVVLNHVDVRRHAEYSYSDSGYYYGRYKKYYTD